jgi:hypothetical protein
LVDYEIRGGLVGNEESLSIREMEIQRNLGVSVFDGLFYAMAWPVDLDRRHVVVAFTDGFDRYSVLEKETLPRLVAHSDAVLHLVLRPNPSYSQGSMGTEWETSREILSEAAWRTGGTVRTETDVAHDFAAIIEDYRTSYLLRYRPRDVPAPGWHDVGVRVIRPGKFDVRARKGYEIGRD